MKACRKDKRLAWLLAVIMGSGISYGAATAQTYPSHTITLIVPFPAGGPTDAVARIVASKLQQSMGAPTIVDNRPGAGAIIGTQLGAKAKKDGYTLLLTTSIVLNLVFNKNLEYKLDDFVPISTLAINPMLLAVRPDLPVNSVQELVAYAKGRPGKFTAGIIGNTGAYLLMMGSLREQTGIEPVNVSYRGSVDALRDLIGGQIDMFFTDPITALPQQKAGRIKILASAFRTPIEGLDVPFLDDLGIHIESGSILTGLYAPAGTPQAIVGRLNDETVKIVASKEYQDFVKTTGTVPASSKSSQFAEEQRKSMTEWSAMKDRLKIELP